MLNLSLPQTRAPTLAECEKQITSPHDDKQTVWLRAWIEANPVAWNKARDVARRHFPCCGKLASTDHADGSWLVVGLIAPKLYMNVPLDWLLGDSEYDSLTRKLVAEAQRGLHE